MATNISEIDLTSTSFQSTFGALIALLFEFWSKGVIAVSFCGNLSQKNIIIDQDSMFFI